MSPLNTARKRVSVGRWIARSTLLSLCLAAPLQAQQDRSQPMSQERLERMQQRHPGLAGALDPENLAKPRPKPPFDMTGTWFIDRSRGPNESMFQPYPEFYEEGQRALKEGAEARAKGLSYRDSIGQCYPAGMPRIMTRVWPIMFVQVPTAIYMVAGFTNSFRTIFLDGRKHTDPDLYVPTYNGEAIGHWEGDTLVVDSRGFETDHHWIDLGIPISDEFRIIERIKMIKDGSQLEIEYIMTDPKMWKGEWRNTKYFDRVPEADIGQVECIDARNANIPGTARGQQEINERSSDSERN